MSLKTLKILIGLLVIFVSLWIAYLYHQVPHRQAPFAKAAGQVERIAIEQGSRKVELQKQTGNWKVLSSTGTAFPANESQIQSTISSLKDLQIEDEISDRADRASDYEVTPDSGTRVRFLDAKGTVLAEGIFGKQSPDYSHIYFRYPDRPNVYLARGLFRGELGQPDPDSWRQKEKK